MRPVFIVLAGTTALAGMSSEAHAFQFDPPPAFEEVYARVDDLLGEPVPAATFGATAWGDLDSDGDLDLVVSGNTGSFERPEPILQIYYNEGDFATQDIDTAGVVRDAFVTVYRRSGPVERELPVWMSAVALSDADGDGDADLLATGVTASGEAVTQVYRNLMNEFGDRLFAGYSSLPGVRDGALAWVDFDNDGDQDFLIAGTANDGSAMSRLYRNDGSGRFSAGPELPGMHSPAADWADYDGDGDHDLVMTGVLEPQEFATRLYRNDGGGMFTEVDMRFPALLFGSVAWGDYESDGDVDLLLTGGALHPFLIRGNYAMYENVGGALVPGAVQVEDQFVGEAASGRYRGSARWGDWDGDGFLDFFLAGSEGAASAPQVQVYRSAGLRRFAAHAGRRYTMAPFAGGYFSTTAWGDYDGDNDLDVLLLRQEDQSGAIRLAAMRNYLAGIRTNTAPEPPDSMSAGVSGGGTVTLTWTRGRDRQTLDRALTYNVRIGTTPGGSDIMPPLADPYTGRRLIARYGNAGTNLEWQLSGLGAGTYYWSVQAIDNGYRGSSFPPEASFTIP